jgi:hypothetical protein
LKERPGKWIDGSISFTWFRLVGTPTGSTKNILTVISATLKGRRGKWIDGSISFTWFRLVGAPTGSTKEELFLQVIKRHQERFFIFTAMIQEKNYRISLAENTLLGKQVLAQQPAISFAVALAQVQRLKKISVINQQLKKSRQKH